MLLTALALGHVLIAPFARGETNKADWWSFKPAARPAVPATSDSRWDRNDVDRFILAKLREQDLSPSREADRRTLIRRLTFDLIGLPPTPEEVSAFLADTRANAYEKLVDRCSRRPATANVGRGTGSTRFTTARLTVTTKTSRG
jgi:hypothetical protein